MKNTLFLIFSTVLILVSSCRIEINPDRIDLDFRELMRQFVIEIAEYAHHRNESFIIVPQNGQELFTLDGEWDGEWAQEYLQAVDGTGREDLFFGYNGFGQETPEDISQYWIQFLERLKTQNKKILVIDYCSEETQVDYSYFLNESQGYVGFAAPSLELNCIPSYPQEPYNNNPDDVQSLKEVKNFLYLINPENFNSKEQFIRSLSSTGYDLFIVDLFFQDTMLTLYDLQRLKRKPNGNQRLVLCYMSIGEAEDYRYYWDSSWERHPPIWLEEENPDWEGNYKVRYWENEWHSIIIYNDDSYLNKILAAGFDGVYLDLIDAFYYFEESN